jgi:hypothetical protein
MWDTFKSKCNFYVASKFYWNISDTRKQIKSKKTNQKDISNSKDLKHKLYYKAVEWYIQIVTSNFVS